MAVRQFADLQLRCTWCGDAFIFSAGEQQLYALRGVERQPDRCPGCARNRTLQTFQTSPTRS